MQVKGFSLYSANGIEKPRACVLASNQLHCLLITNLTSKDTCAVLSSIMIGGVKRKVCFASVYMPGDSEVPPPSDGLRNIIEWCSLSNIPLIMGVDTNSHHTLWGSRDCNIRGYSLMNYLVSTDLDIVNRGHEPTFVASNRQSVIDVTLVSRGLVHLIEEWHVSDEASLSDHRYILFSIKQDRVPPSYGRNPKRTDWEQYRECLERRVEGGSVRLQTEDKLEEEVLATYSAITTSYHQACPLTRTKQFRKVPWWGPELAHLRRQSRRLFRRARASKSEQDWQAYYSTLRLYKKEIRKRKTSAWRRFCSEVETTPIAGRMQRLLNKDRSVQVGLLMLPDGQYTQDSESTLSHLLSVHFPGSAPLRAAVAPSHEGYSPSDEDWRVVEGIVTQSRVDWAVGVFKPYKAAGDDGIFPALLQQGLGILGPCLLRILSACLALGYIPKAWRDIKVVFIPKPGRVTYSLAKSYRPISLSSFVLKTLERLVDRNVREVALTSHPLSLNQHAYIAGRSTESALHKLVSRIEKSFSRKEYTLVVFLDIEGAFDNAAFCTIDSALQDRGVHPVVTRWIGNLLRCRFIYGQLGETKVQVSVTRGTPQGGVLSPLLWDLVVDSLLQRLEAAGIYAQFYSDDGVLVVSGLFLDVVCSIMQRALIIVQEWCTEQSLSVNPQKTEMVLFTKKRKFEGFRAPYLYGVQLHLSKEAKYLGVILDSKLLWNSHLEQKCRKATAAFWQCRRAVGRTWGLTPRITHWIYTVCIRPMLVYGSIVWWTRGTLATAQEQLSRVQRLACMGITGAMRTTPTAAMEAFLGIIPLHTFVIREAFSACQRLVRTGQWTKAHWPGHCTIKEGMIREIPLSRFRSDYLVRKFRFSRRFRVCIPPRVWWEDCTFMVFAPTNLVGYTDGSLSNSAGAGVYIPEFGVQLAAPLGLYATVFQAEVWSILTCCQEIKSRGCKDRQIYICSDSTSALWALSSTRFVSKLVLECFQALQDLTIGNRVTLVWVPGHSGHEGNEIADSLAKEGSLLPFLGPEPAIGISSLSARHSIVQWSHVEHCVQWGLITSCRQAREFLDKPTKALSKELLALSRALLRQYIAVMTGHNTLNYHLSNIGVAYDSLCLLCGEEEETSYHFLCECEAFAGLRHSIFGQGLLLAGDIKGASVKDILAFIRRSGRLD